MQTKGVKRRVIMKAKLYDNRFNMIVKKRNQI